jgi:hypothetical protein
MTSNQRAKQHAPETEQDGAGTDRPIWFLGKELKARPAEARLEPAAPKAVKARHFDKGGTIRAAPLQEEPEEPADSEHEDRRPSPLEAYMRYAKMREPREDDLLAPVETRDFSRGGYALAKKNDIDWDETPRRHARPRAARGLRMRDAFFAGIASIAIGAVGGAVVYDRANDGDLSQSVSDSIGRFLTGLNLQSDAVAAASAGAIVPESRSTPASFKKPVPTARLDVNDAKGNVNTPIPLSISAEPAVPDQVIALRLTGLPADAYLTAGTKLANNAWLLKPREAMGVKLMVPKAESSSLLIAVEAIEPRTGDLAAPTEEINVDLSTRVLPVSAPAADAVKRNFNLPSAPSIESAAAQPVAAPAESDKKPSVADSATLMRNGDKLFDVGDFAAARAFFSRARDLGNREASLRLGRTYDPVVFRDRNVQGLRAEPTVALKYYLEARTAGIEDADNAINGLESWLKQ